MVKIEDGKGRGFSAEVTDEQHLSVDATTDKRVSHESREHGRAFVWTSTFATGTTDVEVLYIKNTSTIRKLFIDSMRYSASAACIFSVFKHTGTATGTTITAENLNFSSSNDAEAQSLGDGAVTEGTIGNAIAFMQVVANADSNRNWNGEIILGEGDSIIVTASANATVHLAITGFFE